MLLHKFSYKEDKTLEPKAILEAIPDIHLHHLFSSNFCGGFFADYMIRRETLEKTKIRKIFQSLCTLGSSACMAIIPLANCNKTLVITLLMLGAFLYGMNAGGEMAIVADMTNNFTATVFAVANTVAFSCGFLTPLAVGLIVEAGDQTRHQWSYVFYSAAAINIFGGIVFNIFASAQQQHWDKDPGPTYIHRI